jgi:hypothetical protein
MPNGSGAKAVLQMIDNNRLLGSKTERKKEYQ